MKDKYIVCFAKLQHPRKMLDTLLTAFLFWLLIAIVFMRETLCRCAKDKRSGKQAGRRYTTNTLTYILFWLSQQRPHQRQKRENTRGWQNFTLLNFPYKSWTIHNILKLSAVFRTNAILLKWKQHLNILFLVVRTKTTLWSHLTIFLICLKYDFISIWKSHRK